MKPAFGVYRATVCILSRPIIDRFCFTSLNGAKPMQPRNRLIFTMIICSSTLLVGFLIAHLFVSQLIRVYDEQMSAAAAASVGRRSKKRLSTNNKPKNTKKVKGATATSEAAGNKTDDKTPQSTKTKWAVQSFSYDSLHTEYFLAESEYDVMRHYMGGPINFKFKRTNMLYWDVKTWSTMLPDHTDAPKLKELHDKCYKAGQMHVFVAELSDDDVAAIWEHFQTGGEGDQDGNPAHEHKTVRITPYREPVFREI